MNVGKYVTNALLSLSVFALLFLSLEIGTRIFDLSTLQDDPATYRSSSAVYDHVLIPNSSGRYVTHEWNVHYNINSLGLREKEYSIEKPEGVTRILVLGDSFAEGFGVEQNESFHELGERENLERGMRLLVLV